MWVRRWLKPLSDANSGEIALDPERLDQSFEPEGGDETRQGRIHRQLRDAILKGRLTPGTRLTELELSKHFGSSRAPVREAIRRLESEGLVRSDFWRGSRVAEHSPQELYELYALRAVIEGYAAHLLPTGLSKAEHIWMDEVLDAMQEAADRGDWLAVAQHDTQWHRIIMVASKRPVLLAAWENANGPLQMTFSRTAGAFYNAKHIKARHHAVIDAITNKRSMVTEEVIRSHYLETAERLLETLQTAAGSDGPRAIQPEEKTGTNGEEP